MSAFFKLKLDDEEREIEITRDGELIVLDHDWAQDDMMTFMTGQKSGVRKLLDDWQDSPIKVICFYFLSMKKPDLLMIATDWAEHVLKPVRQKHSWFMGYPESVNGELMAALGLVRRLASGDLKERGSYEVKQRIDGVESNINGIKTEIGAIAESFYGADSHQVIRPKLAYDFAVEAVLSALHAASWICENVTYDFMVVLSAQGAADNAETASGYLDYDPNQNLTAALREGKLAERSWQVRHFVHAMERVQSGKKWPSIKETP